VQNLKYILIFKTNLVDVGCWHGILTIWGIMIIPMFLLNKKQTNDSSFWRINHYYSTNVHPVKW